MNFVIYIFLGLSAILAIAIIVAIFYIITQGPKALPKDDTKQ